MAGDEMNTKIKMLAIILISIIITKIASIVPINIATKKKIIDNLHNN